MNLFHFCLRSIRLMAIKMVTSEMVKMSGSKASGQ